MRRRDLIVALAATPLIGAAKGLAEERRPGLAISIDDFDLSDGPTMSGWERDGAIRTVLAKHRITAAGFPAGKYIDNPIGQRVLKAWSDDGHLLGNHSYSHGYYGGKDPQAEMGDILRCEPLVARYPAFRKLFRFPYLAEGKTSQGRDALRTLLRQTVYRVAPVTIDTSDWYIDARLVARLRREKGEPIATYRRFYLAHLMDRAHYYDGLAQAVFGHSIDHVILLHHRLTTALFLDDALGMFRREGWRLVAAKTALAQPELSLQPDTIPSGQSLLWALAKQQGAGGPLRYPGEDGDYESGKMDSLAL